MQLFQVLLSKILDVKLHACKITDKVIPANKYIYVYFLQNKMLFVERIDMAGDSCLSKFTQAFNISSVSSEMMR